MKRFHQLFLVGQFVCLLVLAITVFSPVQAEEINEEQSCQQCEMQVRKEVKVHLDFYYELLAEKYAPDELEKWREIRKERDLLRKKLNEAKKRGEIEQESSIGDEWLEKHRQLQESFRLAVEKRDEEQLRSLLPKLFDQYNQLNEHYKVRLNMKTSS